MPDFNFTNQTELFIFSAKTEVDPFIPPPLYYIHIRDNACNFSILGIFVIGMICSVGAMAVGVAVLLDELGLLLER